MPPGAKNLLAIVIVIVIVKVLVILISQTEKSLEQASAMIGAWIFACAREETYAVRIGFAGI